MSTVPGADIIAEFGEKAEPVLMSGGEGLSYKVANIVLKPAQDTEQVSWNAEVLEKISENGFRVVHAVKTLHGAWTYKGWQAFYYLAGEERKGNWAEKIAISRRFHKELQSFPKPEFLGKRGIPWEHADVAVWSEKPIIFHPTIQPITNLLLLLLKPIQVQEQLIHGDMTGNILFDSALPPAIIDFSPYWRPPEYATAIICVDAIVWEGAPDELLSEMKNTEESNQLLIRAALWRIKTSELFSKDHGKELYKTVEKYKHLTDLFKQRVETQHD